MVKKSAKPWQSTLKIVENTHRKSNIYIYASYNIHYTNKNGTISFQRTNQKNIEAKNMCMKSIGICVHNEIKWEVEITNAYIQTCRKVKYQNTRTTFKRMLTSIEQTEYINKCCKLILHENQMIGCRCCLHSWSTHIANLHLIFCT